MEKFEEFRSAGIDLYLLGMVDPGGGSMSMRAGGRMMITRKNAVLGRLTEEDIIEVPLDGTDMPVDAPKDMPVHMAIYKETASNAAISANPPYATALSLTTDRIVPLDQRGQTLLRAIPVLRMREKSGFEEMVKMLPPIFKSGYVASVVKEYGSFTVGGDLLEALQNTTMLERSCKMIAINKSMTPPEVRKEPIRERRSAIPPGIGVMDRSRGYKRGFGR